MKKLLILGLILGLIFSTSVFAGNNWLVRTKQPDKDGTEWILYEDGSKEKIKPDMQGPYGHDKDSGREKRDRGRPIRDDRERNLTVDIGFTEHRILYAQRQIEVKTALHEKYPDGGYNYTANYWIGYLEDLINRPRQYNDGEPMRRNGVDSIGYTVTIPDGSKRTSLRVTATLTSVNDYFSGDSRRMNPVTNTEIGMSEPIQYKAGGIIDEQTQEIVLGRDNNTFSSTYTPPIAMIIGRNDIYAKLTITVTEEKSGASYSETYCWTLRIRI